MAGAVAASGCRPCRKRLAALTKPGPNGEPTTTDTGPRQATSSHGHGWQMARRATSSDGNDSSYKRGVTGSIPVAPTRAKRSCFHLRILPMGAQVGAGFPGALPERGQPPVEGGHGRPWLGAAVLIDARPCRDRRLPPPRLAGQHFLDHLVGDVGVVVGDVARGAVAEAVTAQNPGDPVAAHRRLVAVPQAVRCQARNERRPRAFGQLLGLRPVHAPHRHRDAGERVAFAVHPPAAGVVAAAAFLRRVDAVGCGPEDPGGVLRPPGVTGLGPQEQERLTRPAGARAVVAARAPAPAAMSLDPLQEGEKPAGNVDVPPRALLWGREVELAIQLDHLPFDADIEMIPAAVRAADIRGLQPVHLAPPQPGEGDQQDPDELGLAAEEPAALGEQQRGVLRGPDLLRRAPGPVLAGLAAPAALAAGRIHLQVPGGDGVGQDRMQAAPGAADVLDGVAALINERAFPAVDLLARKRPDRAVTEGWQDEAPDRRGVVGPGGEVDVA